jgi:hypothetical protein
LVADVGVVVVVIVVEFDSAGACPPCAADSAAAPAMRRPVRPIAAKSLRCIITLFPGARLRALHLIHDADRHRVRTLSDQGAGSAARTQIRCELQTPLCAAFPTTSQESIRPVREVVSVTGPE